MVRERPGSESVSTLVGKLEVADGGVVEVLGSGAVEPDVVGKPVVSEVVAAGGALSDGSGH